MVEVAPEACLTVPNPLELPWRVLIVKSLHEAQVAALLDSKHYDRFLPTYAVLRRWRDRKKNDRPAALSFLPLCKVRLARAGSGAPDLRRPADTDVRERSGAGHRF